MLLILLIFRSAVNFNYLKKSKNRPDHFDHPVIGTIPVARILPEPPPRFGKTDIYFLT